MSIYDKLFVFLKNQEYQIKLLYVLAPDEIRCNSIEERNKTFAHCNLLIKKNVKNRSLFLAKKLPLFLDWSNEISFYFRKHVHESAHLVARWTKNTTSSELLGTLQIFFPNEYSEFKKIHNAAVKTLHRPDLEWEALVDKKSKIVIPQSFKLERKKPDSNQLQI